jgi:chromosome segregation ATPase
MSEENSQNFSELEFKEQLYVFYLEIKGELTKKNIEIEKDQLQEIVNSTNPSIILNYIRELFYMLINIKFPQEEEIEESNTKKISNKSPEYSQLENHIKKLEYDIRLFLQKEFQNKIKRDTLEMKLNAYMEMETEFEELKEKVKYEGGKFLNNDRKDNEIIILRRENSNLKKEINKIEEKSKDLEKKYKDDQDIINGLKFKISQLNKKNEELKEEINNLKNKNNKNEMINVNKHIKEHYNKTIEKSTLDKININNINNLYGDNSNKKTLHLKRDLTNYHFPINNCNAESTKIDPIKALNTIDSGNKLAISNLIKYIIQRILLLL